MTNILALRASLEGVSLQATSVKSGEGRGLASLTALTLVYAKGVAFRNALPKGGACSEPSVLTNGGIKGKKNYSIDSEVKKMLRKKEFFSARYSFKAERFREPRPQEEC